MQHELARQKFGLSELASVLSDLVTWAKIPEPVANSAEWAKGYREKLRSAAQLPDMQQQLVKDAITAGLALIARWEHSTNLQRIPPDQWGLAADRRLVEDVAAAARKVRMQAACLMNRSEALQLIRQWQDPGKWSALAKTEKDIAQYQKWADILGGDVRLNLEQGNLQAAEECRKAADMNRGAVWTLRQQVFDLREEYLRIENWVRANVPQLLGEVPVPLDVSQTPDLAAIVTALRKLEGSLLAGVPGPDKQPIDDSKWPRITNVANGLGINKGTVSKLLASGELTDNGKTGSSRRVDPATVLAYCDAKRIAYNDK